MTLGSHDLAILSARMGVMRMGASRMGFCPDDVKHGGDEPGEYNWKEVKPPTTPWALQSQMSMCGKRRVALTLGATPNPQAALSPVQFTAAASGGWPPYVYDWHFGDAGPWIPRYSALYAYWSLNELTGTRAKTLGSGSDDLAEVGGTIGSATGHFGNCAVFNRADGAYLQTSGDPSIGIGIGTGWTFAVLVNRTSLTDNGCILSHADAGGFNFELYERTLYAFNDAGDHIFITLYPFADPLASGGPAELRSGVWDLVVGRCDFATGMVSVQVNGGTPKTKHLDGNFVTPIPAKLSLGASGYFATVDLPGDPNFFSGKADAPMVWPVALTDSECSELFESLSREQNPQHTYLNAGTYTASCRAVDEFGNSETKTIDVTITPAPTVVVSGTIYFTQYADESNPTPPWPGVTVELFDSLNVSLGTTVTGAAGTYSFSDPALAGVDVYIVVFSQRPPGEDRVEFGVSTPNQTTITGTITIDLICDLAGG